MRARSRVFALVVAAFLLTATPVHAALWLTLDRAEGSSGELVRGRTYPGAVTLAPNQSLPLYLAASSTDAPRPDSPGLTPLPPLVIDGEGTGTVTFRIPRVAAGAYDLWVHCDACVPRRSTLLPVGALTVLDLPPTDALPSRERSVPESWPGIIAALLIVAILTAIFAVAGLGAHRQG